MEFTCTIYAITIDILFSKGIVLKITKIYDSMSKSVILRHE